MLKLLYKFILLFFVLVIIAEISWSFIDLPYSWGNAQLNTKLVHLKEKNMDPENYFLGSSTTFRQIDATLFDTLSSDQGHSFNLGMDGAFPPQTYFILEHLIEEDSSIKYLFMELNSHDYFGQNFGTTRSKYYLNTRWVMMFNRYIYASSVAIVYKLGASGLYFYSYLEKLFGLGMRKEYLTQISRKNVLRSEGVEGRVGDGFYPLPGKTTNPQELEELPAQVEKIEKEFKQAYQDVATKKMPYNVVLKEQLEGYLALAEKKNIHLIYVLYPMECVFDTTAEMVALFQELPDKNKIDLANPSKYPELYLLENRYDKGHLNTEGSAILSKELALSFNRLIY